MLLWDLLQRALILGVIIACYAKPQDYENRPYKFGFNVEGQQHRQEEKNEQGLVNGEFGFITADGVYHVTVYATDEQGRFRIVSMKSIKVSPPLDGSADPSSVPIEANIRDLQNPVSAQPAYPDVPAYAGPLQPIQPSYNNAGPLQPNIQSLSNFNLIPEAENPYVTPAPGPQPGNAAFTTLTPLQVPACSGCAIPSTTPSPDGRKPFVFQTNFDQDGEQPVFDFDVKKQQNNVDYGGVKYQKTAGQSQQQYPNPNQQYQNPSQQQYQDPNQQQYQDPNQQQYQDPNQQQYEDPNQQQYQDPNQQQYEDPNQQQYQNPSQQQYKDPNQQYQNQVQNSKDARFNARQNEIVRAPSKELLGPRSGDSRDEGLPELNFSPLPPNVLDNSGLQSIDPVYNPEFAVTPVPPNFVESTGRSSKKPPTSVPKDLFFPGLIHPTRQSAPPGENPQITGTLPPGVTVDDMRELLYRFNYSVGFHGHYETGFRNGRKIGGYYVNGRDGYSRIVEYVADENGYRPKVSYVYLGLDSEDTPKEETEKNYGLKGQIFEWFSLN